MEFSTLELSAMGAFSQMEFSPLEAYLQKGL